MIAPVCGSCTSAPGSAHDGSEEYCDPLASRFDDDRVLSTALYIAFSSARLTFVTIFRPPASSSDWVTPSALSSFSTAARMYGSHGSAPLAELMLDAISPRPGSA